MPGKSEHGAQEAELCDFQGSLVYRARECQPERHSESLSHRENVKPSVVGADGAGTWKAESRRLKARRQTTLYCKQKK